MSTHLKEEDTESRVSAQFWGNLGPRPYYSSAWPDLFELYHVAAIFCVVHRACDSASERVVADQGHK